MNKTKVFLGGTCNGSEWRNELINMLNIDYFNPVVENWTPECMVEEIKQRENCDFCLYVITPEMEGVYSIAEVVDDSNKRPTKTIFCLIQNYGDKEFSKTQIKSLDAVGKMVVRNGALYFKNLYEVSIYLNMKNNEKINESYSEYWSDKTPSGNVHKAWNSR